jgi:hypothetical protein
MAPGCVCAAFRGLLRPPVLLELVPPQAQHQLPSKRCRVTANAGSHRHRQRTGYGGGFARGQHYGAASGSAGADYNPFGTYYRGGTGSSYWGWRQYQRRRGVGALQWPVHPPACVCASSPACLACCC